MNEQKTIVRKISRGFQITIPRTLRETFGLHIGDMIEFEQKDDMFILRPVEVIRRKEMVQKLKHILENQQENEFSNLSEDEIMTIANEEIRKSRKERKKQ
ncbi:MAG: AbrB/MazE/SpoVT family DNA-binding domain-containing protein [Nitrospirae bacterium]|nr:AbrB/MazE/SpoVT family DNA-binding domain-containing protein [Nitrospirota bacterium]MBF0534467.1 AbrB/MazE/SpoVT family DNA-binding domain-containing protein [Nitrospirota bacterium]MBF0617093.1 AbrB/MazE/SpoVT family DNA-binding domain-containing protein [Nitrospirota bacterium]